MNAAKAASDLLPGDRIVSPFHDHSLTVATVARGMFGLVELTCKGQDGRHNLTLDPDESVEIR